VTVHLSGEEERGTLQKRSRTGLNSPISSCYRKREPRGSKGSLVQRRRIEEILNLVWLSRPGGRPVFGFTLSHSRGERWEVDLNSHWEGEHRRSGGNHKENEATRLQKSLTTDTYSIERKDKAWGYRSRSK